MRNGFLYNRNSTFLWLDLDRRANISPAEKPFCISGAKHNAPVGDGCAQRIPPDLFTPRKHRQRMNAVLQVVAHVVDTHPIRHPETPGIAPCIGNFIKDFKIARQGGVVPPGRNVETEHKLIILVSIQVLLGDIHQDVFFSSGRLNRLGRLFFWRGRRAARNSEFLSCVD